MNLPAAALASARWWPVVSSNVRRVAWVPNGDRLAVREDAATDDEDRELGTLFVEFSTGSTYAYDECPEALLEELVHASQQEGFSVGRTFDVRVAKADKPYQRVHIQEVQST